MPELNRAERRSLVCATLLVVSAAAVRVGAGLGDDGLTWTAPPGTSIRPRAALQATQAAVAAGIDRAERAARPLAPDEKLDPNAAPAVELERLPGIGPGRAHAIVEDRRRRGPFRTLDDLARVRGIGPSTLQRLAPHLTLPSAAMATPAGDGRARTGARLGDPDRAPGGHGAGPGPGGRKPPVPRLDVNRATAAELERLPGIGPTRARRVIETRARLGGFTRVDDLLEVPGIGPATLDKLRPLVYVP